MPPLIIRKQKYLIAYYLIWLPYILAYVLSNRYPLFKPVQFPITALDQAIPFLPLMIPIYVSYLVFVFFLISRLPNDQLITEIFYITHIQLLICLCFFLLYPVTYPRDLYYYENPVAHLFNQFWIWFDAPNNCFPSLHTANCCVVIQYRRDSWLCITWSVLIIIATLTCKQHYIIDVLAGILVYGISIVLFQFWKKSWK